MHLVHTLYVMLYEWDEVKRHENLRRHGVDFADVVSALEDPGNLTIQDPDAESEVHYLTLGMDAALRVLIVVWTEPTTDRIRIISARKASPGETRRYHGA